MSPSPPRAAPTRRHPLPRRRTAAGRARGPRRLADRRLVLAPRPGRPCRHRPPRGGERLHRGGHGRHRRRSGRGCSTRSWPGSKRPTSRCRCARGPGCTTAAPWRAATTPSTADARPWDGGRRLARPGPRRVPGRRADPVGREPAGRRARLLRAGEPRRQPGPPVAGLLHRHVRRRALHDALRRPRAPAPSRPSRSRTPRTGWPGPTTTPRSSTSGWTRPCGPTSSGATGSAPIPPGTSLVYEEADERFYLGVGRTRDDRFVLVGLDSKMTSEVVVPRRRPTPGEPTVVEPRRQGVEYSVEHDRGDPDQGRPSRFLIVTNDGAEDFRLMEAPDATPGRTTGARSSRPGTTCGSTASTPSPATSWSTSATGGRPGSGSSTRSTGASEDVARPESPSTVWAGANPEYESTTLRYEYSSLVTPRSVYDLDLGTGEVALLKRQPVLGDFDPDRYRTERRWARGRRRHRGAHVAGLPARPGRRRRWAAHPACSTATAPTRRRSTRRSARCGSACSTGGSSSPSPTSAAGARLGRRWYEEGKLAAKPTTFTDFVACARTRWSTAGSPPPTAWWPAGPVPVACSWGRWPTWHPDCSGPWWPRCPSSTA